MKKRVLFICTGNSCRSQMAEGLSVHLAGDRFEVQSAGVKPTEVNPLAIKVMKEIGIDISGQKSKSLNDLSGRQFDYVISVCDNARRTCPVFPGKYEKIHWNLEDPAKADGTEYDKLKAFRAIRDQIKRRIEEWIGNLDKSV